MKNQDKGKKLKCRLLLFLFGALMVNTSEFTLKTLLWDMRFWPFTTEFCLKGCF